jgi:hypothetical protein
MHQLDKLPFSDSNVSVEKHENVFMTVLISRFSGEVVIVEVPTRDGIEHEDDDVTQLYSQCVPRMAVYMIFPIAVLVFILGFAFI